VNGSIGKFFLSCFLGLLIGAVLGVLLDRMMGASILSFNLLKSPIHLEFYIILVEIQITPASLIGLVVSGYLVLKKG